MSRLPSREICIVESYQLILHRQRIIFPLNRSTSNHSEFLINSNIEMNNISRLFSSVKSDLIGFFHYLYDQFQTLEKKMNILKVC